MGSRNPVHPKDGSTYPPNAAMTEGFQQSHVALRLHTMLPGHILEGLDALNSGSKRTHVGELGIELV